jgi:phosphoglycolate phosphatase
MYRLVVFDLDGTLLDSLGDLCVAVNRLLAEYGGRQLSSAEVARMVGEGAGVLVARARVASGARVEQAEALARFLDIYDSLLPGEAKPYPGIREVLERAASDKELVVRNAVNRALREATT